jgi:TonB family protein
MKTLYINLLICYFFFFGGLVLWAQDSQSMNNEPVFDTVDRIPYLKGHKKSQHDYFQKRMQYPSEARLASVEGIVYVSFVVSKVGTVDSVSIQQSPSYMLNNEAIRLIENSGPWKPGKKDGMEVNTRMVVPVKFALTDQEKAVASQLARFNQMEEPPLFVLDNKIINDLVEVEHYNVRSIRVIKGQKAIQLYGAKAKQGVVVITTKMGTPPLY